VLRVQATQDMVQRWDFIAKMAECLVHETLDTVSLTTRIQNKVVICMKIHDKSLENLA
jgi:hypothetical protein